MHASVCFCCYVYICNVYLCIVCSSENGHAVSTHGCPKSEKIMNLYHGHEGDGDEKLACHSKLRIQFIFPFDTDKSLASV